MNGMHRMSRTMAVLAGAAALATSSVMMFSTNVTALEREVPNLKAMIAEEVGAFSAIDHNHIGIKVNRAVGNDIAAAFMNGDLDTVATLPKHLSLIHI